jgi:type VI secretion system Hcp family effector
MGDAQSGHFDKPMVKTMDKKKSAAKAGNANKSRWLKVVIVSLIVMGGAVTAGSALAKDKSPGEGNSDSSSSVAPQHTSTHYGISFKDQYGNKSAAFEIKDFSFGVENPTTIGSATGGAGAGKIKFNEFTIKKTSDSSSPLFFKNCAVGAHYKEVTLEMRKVNDKNSSDSVVYQRFTFGTVFTTKIDWSGPGDEGPEESITFVYGVLSVEYVGQDPAASSSFAWDSIQNRQP